MSTEPTRTQQHLVSRGYQQNFADDRFVSIVNSETGAIVDERRPTKTNWRVPDFLSVMNPDGEPDDALEKEFAQDERIILNRVRDIRAFAKVADEQKHAVDVLTAIHIVRSRSYEKRHVEVVTGWLTNDASQIADRPELRAHFVAWQGRQPAPGELERMVTKQALALGRDPNLHPNGVRYGATRLGQLFSHWFLQLVEIDLKLPGLVLPDYPILHGRLGRGLFGFDAGPVGESDIVLVPITRRLAGVYSPSRLADVRI